MSPLTALFATVLTLATSVAVEAAPARRVFECADAKWLELKADLGPGRFMMPIQIRSHEEPILGDLVDRRAPKTLNETLSLNVSMNCGLKVSKDGFDCETGHSVINATYTYLDGDDVLTVSRRLGGMVTISVLRDESGVFQLNANVVTHPENGPVRKLEIRRAIGSIDGGGVSPFRPGCQLL